MHTIFKWVFSVIGTTTKANTKELIPNYQLQEGKKMEYAGYHTQGRSYYQLQEGKEMEYVGYHTRGDLPTFPSCSWKISPGWGILNLFSFLQLEDLSCISYILFLFLLAVGRSLLHILHTLSFPSSSWKISPGCGILYLFSYLQLEDLPWCGILHTLSFPSSSWKISPGCGILYLFSF